MGALVFNILIGLVFVYQILSFFFSSEKRVNIFFEYLENVMTFNLHNTGVSEATFRSP